MAEDKPGELVDIRKRTENFIHVNAQSPSRGNDGIKKEVVEEYESQEDSSQSDYELSLREENIRLKSRLEQAKEKSVRIEENAMKYKEELQKEKEFSEKANESIYTLMSDKSALEDELKRKPKGHKGLEDVVRKLEHEIYLLEDRLERQRKRHHHEHLLIYDDLKDERRRQFEWKQTYLRSQVSVMAFRRKLELLRINLRQEDHKELMKCLEIGLHDCEEETTYKSEKKDPRKPSSKYQYSTHPSSQYDIKRSSHDNYDINHYDKTNSPHDSYDKYHDKTRSSRDSYDAHNDNYRTDNYRTSHDKYKRHHDKNYEKQRNQNSEALSLAVRSIPVSSVNEKPHREYSSNGRKHTENGHGTSSSPESSDHNPKVFIVDDESSFSVNKLNSPPDPVIDVPPRDHNNQDGGPPSYEKDHKSHSPRGGNRAVKTWTQYTPKELSATHYKHWHHYSVDNPGHRDGSATNRIEDIHQVGERDKSPGHPPPVISSAPSKKYNEHIDNLELNVNDTRFLELKFDNGFLKSEPRSNHNTKSNSGGLPAADSSTGRSHAVAVGTPLDQKKIWCLTCDGEVTKKLCGHSNLVVQEREKEFPCPTCHRIFNNRSHLKRHNMIHSGEKPWACNYCEKRFNRKSHLNRHVLTHTGERPFKCPYCGKGFADNSDLKRHKQIHESTPGFVPIRPKEVAPVALAPQVTSSQQMLPLTMMVTPSVSSSASYITTTFSKKKQEAKFPCNKCGKIFTRKSHLTRHKLTHDQIKIYCDCGRMFRQKAHLQAHLPACKRKRQAIEAKFQSEHPTGEGMIPKSEAPSPINEMSYSPAGDYHHGDEVDEHSMEYDHLPGYTHHDFNNGESDGRSTPTYDLNDMPGGMPPLIRDPV